MITMTVLGAAALFGLGLVTGLVLLGGERRERPARPLSGPESPEESLARLTPPVAPPRVTYGGFPMKGGQVLMGPNQPRPQVQKFIPLAPPKGS